MAIVPVTQESPQAPPKQLKLERQTHAKGKNVYSSEEVLETPGDDESEADDPDECEQVVNKPGAAREAVKPPPPPPPLTRVDKLRMLAQS